MKHGFFPVYFPVSNKCLSTVKFRGAAAEYIPQSSGLEKLLAIKGKADRDESWRRDSQSGGCESSFVILSRCSTLDVVQAGTLPI